MKEKNNKSCLLIGNSRWHWAVKNNKDWDFKHTSCEEESLQYQRLNLIAWASVGAVPKTFLLDPAIQVTLKDIPLIEAPPWLGIDRALASWRAFTEAKESSAINSDGLIVADAGTVFSLTHINGNGKFSGGQLIPGIKLQLNSMASGTKNLSYPTIESVPEEKFPQKTEEAMLKGCVQSLIGALLEAQSSEQRSLPIWLCGGDSQIIYKSLSTKNIEVFHRPNLVMEGILSLKN